MIRCKRFALWAALWAALWGVLAHGAANSAPAQTGLPRPKLGGAPAGTAPRPSTARTPAPKGAVPGAAGAKAPDTKVAVELITGDEGVGLRAQRWSQIFDGMQVNLTIRRANFDDKLGVTDKSVGGAARQVRVIGRLEPQGRLIFADRSFTEADAAKLAAWLQELRTYGAQGTPDGQPVWGLTKAQFGAVHQVLSQRLDVEVEGTEVPFAIAAFAFPKEFPVRFTGGAAKWLQSGGATVKVRQALKGVSKGTALAVLLNEQGLGFRPRRLPSGTIELGVTTLIETADGWPVGWPLRTTRMATAPKLYAYTPVNLQEIELDAVLDAASEIIGMPVLIDYAGLDARKVDLSKVKVSHAADRTTWSLALQALAFKATARPDLWIDEAGKPFIWITPVGTKRSPDRAGDPASK